ncbi:MAG: ABC transporter substrate-binding protein [Caulobacteraceae bacterium]
MSRPHHALLLALALIFAPLFAFAASDPAAARVEAFNAQVLSVMKRGPALGPEGRFRAFLPIVENAFDIPLMTRFAVGPGWATMNEADRRALTTDFARLTAASYARNFDRYSGERFPVDPNPVARGGDRIVKAEIVPTSGAPVQLLYRLHQTGGTWKIVDVYFGAVSQLTTRRADFAGPLASGGAKSLEAHLDLLIRDLLK